MRSIFRFALSAPLILLLSPVYADERPNIILILADDVGFSDIGVYGGEINTPNIDALAREGIQLTNYQAAPTCGPSRTMMLTGIDHHRVGAGINKAGLLRHPELASRPGYEGALNDKVVTVATLLKDAGYHTFMTGKWDPGGDPGNQPVNRGFEKSFVVAGGGGSHFSDAVGTFRATAKMHYFEDEDVVESLPDEFYSSEFYASKMIEYVDGIDDDKPYLGYVAFTAAHWPLQVPDDWINKYRGKYDDGWQAVRESRFARQLESGVIPRHAQLPAQNRAVEDWEDLDKGQRQIEARRMEIYAAMIENMDFQVGRILDEVESRNSARETIVIFLSDNGSEGNAVQRIIGNDVWIPERFDNSLENMGRVNSYVWLGAGWAQANVTPFRIYKSYTTGGGIRTPAIFSSSKGRFAQSKLDGIVTVRDITPTILELAGVAAAVDTYNGKPVLPVSGKSALAYLQSDSPSVHADEPLGWELYGSRALLKGEWKALRIYPPEGSGEWELFNVKTDPTEVMNLADDYGDVLDELIADWDAYAEENGVAVFDEDLGYGRYADPGPD
jgi:arylsulfatase A-like enzyme